MSTKYVEKACHSPYSQNRLRKSPLGFLRFPFLAAFSHKELLGHFDAYADIIVKTAKCRPDVHPDMFAKGSSDTPTVTRDKLASVTAPHLTQRESSPDILNGLVLERFARPWVKNEVSEDQ